MFVGQVGAKAKSKKIVRKLTDYKGNKTHARHIHFDELETMGLMVKHIEDDQEFQDIVLTVHHGRGMNGSRKPVHANKGRHLSAAA